MYHLPYTGYGLLWLFLIYSLFGWMFGVVVAAFRRKSFVNTGVLNSPVCPVYGCTAIAYTIFLRELKHAPIFLFIGGMIIGACMIVLTGTILRLFFHRKWWNYSRFRVGFDGYLTIPMLMLFGAASVLVLFVGNDLILSLVGLIPYRLGKMILAGIYILLAMDLLEVLIVAFRIRVHVKRIYKVSTDLDHISITFGNAITRAVQRRLERAYPNIETSKIVQEIGRIVEESDQKERFAEGKCFYKLFWLFLLGSMFGDFFETIFCRLKAGVWMSRSSLVYGPFSIVWGIGCMMLTAFLYQYRNKSDRYLFFYGTVVGGTYEYACSVLSELLFGTVFWDYSKMPFNLGGRINLLYCFFWGIVAVFWLKVIYPLLSEWIEKIPTWLGPGLTWFLILFMIMNLAISGLAMDRYAKRQNGLEASNQFEKVLDQRFSDERMRRIYPNAKFVRP